MSISLRLIAMLVCGMNISAFYFVMAGWQAFDDVFSGKERKKKAIYVISCLLIAGVISFTRIYIIWAFLLEYMIILITQIRKGRRDFTPAIRGMIDLLSVLAVEMIVFGLAYSWDTAGAFAKGMGNGNYRLVLSCYLAIAMIQYLVAIICNLPKIKTSIRKNGLVMLWVKLLENAILIYLCVIYVSDETVYNRILVLLLLMIFADYPLLINILPQIQEEKQSNMSTPQSMVNMYEYYLQMEEEHRQIRKLYHEMKNKFMIMQENSGQSGVDLSDIANSLQQLDQTRNTYHTGIASLDALLFDGQHKAEQAGIHYEAVIAEGCLSFMQESDVNTIFRNAILNAIEACEQITEGEKWITIKAGKNEENIMVYFRNSASPERKKGALSTIKEDKKLHGIGLTTIRECAEKYNGYVSVIEKDDSFQLAMLF
jgi:hypothetical protein